MPEPRHGPTRIALLAGALIAMATSVCGAQDLPELVDEVVNAYGGPEAVAKMKAYRVSAETTALLRGGKTGRVTRDFGRSGSMRVRIAYPDQTEVRLLRGGSGWRGDDTGVAPVEGPLLASMVYQLLRADLPGVLDRHRERLVDLGTIDDGGVAARELRLSWSDALEVSYRLDAGTFRVREVRGSLRHGASEITFATRYDEYRKVNGVWFPFHEVNYAGGQKVAETRIIEVDWQPAELGPFAPE